MSRITQTIVFQFDSQEQRKATLAQFDGLFLADQCPRISAMSADNEQRRSELMHDALERYADHFDLRDAIERLYGESDLDDFTWEKFEAAE